MGESRRSDAVTQRDDPAVGLGAGCTLLQVPRDLRMVGEIELPVDVGVHEVPRVAAAHERSSFMRGASARASASRPRASRDMTVPMGISATSAISR